MKGNPWATITVPLFGMFLGWLVFAAIAIWLVANLHPGILVGMLMGAGGGLLGLAIGGAIGLRIQSWLLRTGRY